jgi:hypothetical protein
MTKKPVKLAGYIDTYKRLIKTKKGSHYRYYVRIVHANGNKSDANSYETRQGMNKKARSLKASKRSMVIRRLGLVK